MILEKLSMLKMLNNENIIQMFVTWQTSETKNAKQLMF